MPFRVQLELWNLRNFLWNSHPPKEFNDHYNDWRVHAMAWDITPYVEKKENPLLVRIHFFQCCFRSCLGFLKEIIWDLYSHRDTWKCEGLRIRPPEILYFKQRIMTLFYNKPPGKSVRWIYWYQSSGSIKYKFLKMLCLATWKGVNWKW